MSNVFVSFKVSVRDDKYKSAYENEVETEIIVDKSILQSINSGNILEALLPAAINLYEAKKVQKVEKDE